jgi:hypothetical protein
MNRETKEEKEEREKKELEKEKSLLFGANINKANRNINTQLKNNDSK